MAIREQRTERGTYRASVQAWDRVTNGEEVDLRRRRDRADSAVVSRHGELHETPRPGSRGGSSSSAAACSWLPPPRSARWAGGPGRCATTGTASPAPTASPARRRRSYEVTYRKGTLPSQHLAGAGGLRHRVAARARAGRGGGEGDDAGARLPARARPVAGRAAAGSPAVRRLRGRRHREARRAPRSSPRPSRRATRTGTSARPGTTRWPCCSTSSSRSCATTSASAGRMAIMGWSMGGYGALRAAELHPQQFCAVCGVSAALWRSYVGRRRRRVRQRRRLRRATTSSRTWRSCAACRCGSTAAGRTPSTRPTGRSRRRCRSRRRAGSSPGGHNDDYWSRVAPAEIDWIGAQFAKVGRPAGAAGRRRAGARAGAEARRAARSAAGPRRRRRGGASRPPPAARRPRRRPAA